MTASSIPSFDPEFASSAEWAAMYRACGMQVVPARYPMRTKDDKRPALSEWREFQERLVPEAVFHGWFRPGCHPQMGVITGRCSRNAVVVDLDIQTRPEARFWWQAVLEVNANGIEPETWKQTTGGGGRQLVFGTPEGWHAPTNKTPLGVDIRGQGGFAMLPPSRHLSGGTYAWDEGFAPWEVELADAPDWLLQAIDDLVAQHGGDQRAPGGSEYVKHDGPDFDAFAARVDGREDALARWAWRTVVELHRETGGQIPEDRGEARFRASGEHWLRHARTRLKNVDNAEGLERECRGASALLAKCRRAMVKWDGRVRLDAERGRPFGDEEAPRASEPPPGAAASGAGGEEFSARAADAIEPLPIRAAFPVDGATIPTRDWIVAGLLLRRHLSVLVAPPGSGKSLLTLQLACACAVALAWGGWNVRAPVKALVINAEDDGDEMQRRLWAAAHDMGLSQADLADRVFLAEAPESVVIARTDARTKTVVRTPLVERLVATVIANGIGLIIVDPFAETFEGDENANSEVKWAGILWREIARRTGAALLLVHHTRKYAGGMAGDADASRGGGALIGTARIVSTLFGMTGEEADAMGVSEADRTQFVRFDDAKANMALVTGLARWFRKKTIVLPNGGILPADEVGVLVTWRPQGVFDGVSVEVVNRCLDAIERGLTDDEGRPTGDRYSPHRRASRRWVGVVIAQFFGCNDARAADACETWLRSGLLIEEAYRDAKAERTGLRVDKSKRPGSQA